MMKTNAKAALDRVLGARAALITSKTDSALTEVERAKRMIKGGTTVKADVKLGKSDKQVIDAFTSKKAAESKKLTTDGKRLDGNWMGGKNIAEWKGGKIVLNDTGSRSGQIVQRAIKKNAPKNAIAGSAFKVRAAKMSKSDQTKMERAAEKRGDRYGDKVWVEVTSQPEKTKGGNYVGRATFHWQKGPEKDNKHSSMINVGSSPAKLSIRSRKLMVKPKDGEPYIYGEKDEEAADGKKGGMLKKLKKSFFSAIDKTASSLSDALSDRTLEAKGIAPAVAALTTMAVAALTGTEKELLDSLKVSDKVTTDIDKPAATKLAMSMRAYSTSVKLNALSKGAIGAAGALFGLSSLAGMAGASALDAIGSWASRKAVKARVLWAADSEVPNEVKDALVELFTAPLSDEEAEMMEEYLDESGGSFDEGSFHEFMGGKMNGAEKVTAGSRAPKNLVKAISAAKDVGDKTGDKRRRSSLTKLITAANLLEEMITGTGAEGFPEVKGAVAAVKSLSELSGRLDQAQMRLDSAPSKSEEAVMAQAEIDNMRSNIDTMLPPLMATVETMEALLAASVALEQQFVEMDLQVKGLASRLENEKNRLASAAKAVQNAAKIG